ncbi:hypothetical protein PILCRDRAFT_823787 [Piloderma croceum F 1598]|uniref:Uncharacterized protein n=1 Tax=Piloderma croceum (strain F 1598) TaxID=765440 RepID=A0A0C3FHE4_PILCF|nr:hypothetical protein PILCRDRAFT_823787 [Piloderma croceum F 1598]
MFICWDECGGNYLLQKEGIQSLPKILSTGRFHCNMLRSDIRPIFKEDLKPNYSQVTTTYLKGLYERLASHDPVVRASMMVAFEIQGAHMIESLGKALVATYNLEEDLSYCQAHVGGDDPLEVYHVAMTKKLLSTIVTQESKERFINEFRISYTLNFDWCRDITL